MFDNLRNILNFDELLFENRNRDYGAYQLRKRYKSVLVVSIFLASILFGSGIVLPFMFTPDSNKVLSGGYSYVPVQMENFEPPQEQINVPPAAPPPPPARVQEVVNYVAPVIIDSIIPLESTMPTPAQLETLPSNEDLQISGNGSNDDLIGNAAGESLDEPFFVVEIMPSFKGGDINKFRDWVQKRTNYPQIAVDRNLKGKVFLTFIIEPDGSVSNVTIVKGVDPIIDIEAVKAIQSSPKWSPGLQRGQAVRVRYSMWLNFVF